MGKNDGWGAIAALALGALGLALLAKAASSRAPPKCPTCGQAIEQGIKMCPYCRTLLEWK